MVILQVNILNCLFGLMSGNKMFVLVMSVFCGKFIWFCAVLRQLSVFQLASEYEHGSV
jgi:hypothetical protein